MQTSLEGAEVEATTSPDHDLAVEHDVAVQRGHRGDDLREVAGELTLLPGLQRDATGVVEGDAPAS